MRLALRRRASRGAPRCCCGRAPGTGRYAGWAQYLWFWLVAASTLSCFVFIVYMKTVFLGFAGMAETFEIKKNVSSLFFQHLNRMCDVEVFDLGHVR
jgi:hypothetical protein